MIEGEVECALWEPTVAPASEDLYDRACRATTRDGAMSCLAALVALRLTQHPDEDAARAEAFERSAIAYWAGYFSREVRRRVETLYETEHPILGPVDKFTSYADALAHGYAHGQAGKKLFWPRRAPPYPDEP